jgi:dCMP deaminase
LALRCAKQGTCIRRCYGSVLVDEYDTIVATGYTGTPKKKIHCIRCWRQEHNVPPGRNYEKCRSVHSEQNALIQAGKKARGCTLYLAGYDVSTEQ